MKPQEGLPAWASAGDDAEPVAVDDDEVRSRLAQLAEGGLLRMEPAGLRAQFSKLADAAVAQVEQAISTGASSVAAVGGSAAPPLTEPLLEAAAVLSTFDARTLRMPGAREPSDASVARVLADSEPVAGPDGSNRWSLRIEVRRRTFVTIATPDRARELLGANEASRTPDPAQQMFEAYLEGNAPPIDTQESDQVTATFTVSRWLEGLPLGAALGVPPVARIRARSEYLALLRPFRDLAEHNFAGRVAELKRLRDHVGVLPPGSALEGVARAARDTLGWHERDPLMVHGPGGVGKSALIARFLWEHASLDVDRFPYGYIDFDRPGARPEEPLTILIEAVRQLGLQYPDGLEAVEGIRTTWQRELVDRSTSSLPNANLSMVKQAPVTPEGDRWRSSPEDWPRYLSDFARLLARLRVDDAPYLLVLDTFEEVQYRGDVVVASLLEFLKALRQAVERARIVIAGRSRVIAPDIRLEDMELPDFDEPAAEAYLRNRGMEPPELVRSIVRRFGRSPLSLSLAAAAWDQEREAGGGTGSSALADIPTRTAWRRRLGDSQIQGQLYRRILEHVHSDEAKRLAYPGLVLRRLTPDIIRHVLAGPCGVDVPDDETARRLFDELAREVSLVRLEDGALVHRRDVRRIMLQLLRQDRAEKVHEIEESAVAYYAARDTPAERAEEIYHRLGLRQPPETIAKRWEPGLEKYLFSALDEDELPPPERAWLAARLDRPLDPRSAEVADQESWEYATERRVRELLARGQVDRALDALKAREHRLPGSPLLVLEADALERQERWPEARAVLHRAVEGAADRGDAGSAVELLARCAAIDLRLGSGPSALEELDDADRLLEASPNAVASLRVAATRLAAARLRGASDAETDPLEEAVRGALEKVDDATLATDRALAAWVGAELGPSWPPVFQRILSTIGLETSGRRDHRALGRALAEWDDQVAREQDRWPSRLAPDLPYGDTLTQAWTRVVQDASPTALGARIAPLLASYPPTPDLLDTLAETLRSRAGGLATWEPEAKDAPQPPGGAGGGAPTQGATGYADVGATLPPAQQVALADALARAFTRAELGDLLGFRLGRTIDSISPSGNVAETARTVVQVAASEGWLASLAVAALESRPSDAGLHAVAEPLGLTAATTAAVDVAERLSKAGTGTDIEEWRSRLGALEAQVCRVELRGPSGLEAAATGFLVGPDLVLTTEHGIHAVLSRKQGVRAVTLVFDHRRLRTGADVNPGTIYRLSERRWLVDTSATDIELPAPPLEGLDYALLRVAGAPGSEPVGGDRAEPGAPPRGWVRLVQPSDPPPGAPVVVLQHALAGPLTAAVGEVVGASADGTRLHYRLDTAPGSGGAPVFDARLGLVAMHQSRVADDGPGGGVGAGLLVRRLAERLDRLGLLVSQDRRTV